jgi:two-component system, cell cycle sensor histidine kinase and response regulator CckA
VTPPEVQQTPTILIVEDDEQVRKALSRALRVEGYTVVQAENGAVALRELQGIEHSLKLVLTDIRMPVMDGIELAKVLRAAYPSIPILYMSGYLPEASQGTYLREVGARLLLKPFSPDVLLEAIRAALSHERPSAQRTSA